MAGAYLDGLQRYEPLIVGSRPLGRDFCSVIHGHRFASLVLHGEGNRPIFPVQLVPDQLASKTVPR